MRRLALGLSLVALVLAGNSQATTFGHLRTGRMHHSALSVSTQSRPIWHAAFNVLEPCLRTNLGADLTFRDERAGIFYAHDADGGWSLTHWTLDKRGRFAGGLTQWYLKNDQVETLDSCLLAAANAAYYWPNGLPLRPA